MQKKEGKSPRAIEIPICPFCDGKVNYTSWVTHKIFQSLPNLRQMVEVESC